MSARIEDLELSTTALEILLKFFDEQKKQGICYWPASNCNSGLPVRFSQDIIARERKDGKPGLRYEAIGHKISSGGFASIHSISGTLALDSGRALYKTADSSGVKRLVKIEPLENEETVRAIEAESINGRLAGLGTKNPVVVHDSISYMVMREVAGKELLAILVQERDDLPTKTRLDFTKAVLFAVKSQLTDNHIMHLDISPENILMDQSTHPPKATLIDFGFSRKEEEYNPRLCGKPSYVSPEMLAGNQPIDKYADIYSLGVVIAMIWGLEQPCEDKDNLSIDELYSRAISLNLDTLFYGVHDLNDANKELIKHCIIRAVHRDSKLRIGIDELISSFNSLDLTPISVSPPSSSGSALIEHSVFSSQPDQSSEWEFKSSCLFL